MTSRVGRRLAYLGLGLVAPLVVWAANLRPVWGATFDDAFISLRYARNFARGLGLVYQPGERVEGYTNFLWTLLLGGAMRLGLDGERAAWVLGALSAGGLLVATYVLARRLRPEGRVPTLAVWLLASSVALNAHEVAGLETPLFAALVVAGVARLWRERREALAPWSGLVFALATLTRPEGVAWVALALVGLGALSRARRDLVRLALFALPLLAHLGFRRWYYGAWLPQTLFAKLERPALRWGAGYVGTWAWKLWPVLALAALGIAFALRARHRLVLTCGALVVAISAYVLVIGGDWMPGWRYLVVAEPFVYVLADAGAREALERWRRPLAAAVGALLLLTAGLRARHLRLAQRELVLGEHGVWLRTAESTSRWLLTRPRGPIALADIGRVGWVTDWPILDLGGLVDPRMPLQVSDELITHVLEQHPRYLVLLSTEAGCGYLVEPRLRAIADDARVRARYRLVHEERAPGVIWCTLSDGN